ncbi:MAG: bifunctional diaminohydroxyphosphoribosylaminopyrimidine deaminase/5-amino-6-(5-phosphoribosylamino)uracil reductase RibD [Pseudomonadota bacterium]
MKSNIHNHYMGYALRLAARHIGMTGGNPSVGCVIVKDGMVIGTGTTAIGGRPHAEKIAIDCAKHMGHQDLSGATAYVTLEPCAHVGQTGSCAERLIEAEVSACYIGLKDPDPRTAGKGIAKLEAAGIDTYVGLSGDKAAKVHRFFTTRIVQNRPYITLKSAMSLDGYIAFGEGNSRKTITSDAARRDAHLLRLRYNAIAIGVNTLFDDDPALDVRIGDLGAYSPDIVLFDRELKCSADAKILNHMPDGRDRKIIIFHASGADLHDKSHLTGNKNILLYPFSDDLSKAMQILADLGISAVLIEGGAQLVTSFLNEELYDDIVLFRGDVLIGSDGLPAIGELKSPIDMKSYEALGSGHFFKKVDEG